ncbi:MAG: hypothetical protein H6730_33795 [Deltaproteobacteria bacterium]|nr:hypothetical protein [Deltaproteobacteria bacterium]
MTILRQSHWLRAPAWAPYLAAAIMGCGGGSETGPDPDADVIEYTLFDSTRLLAEDTLASLVEATPEGILRFEGTPAALADVAQLDVILAPASGAAPQGLLRLVTSVSQDGNGLVLETVRAPLQLAFRKLHLRFTRKVDETLQADPWVAVHRQALSYTGGYWPPGQYSDYPINGDGDIETPYDQVHIYGDVTAGFTYTVGIDIDWDKVAEIPSKVADCIAEALTLHFSCDPRDFLPEAVVFFSIDAGAKVSLALEGITFLPYAKELSLAEKTLPGFWLGPLYFEPSVEIVAKVEGEASAEFAISASADASAQAGVSISNISGVDVDAPTFDKNFGPPTVAATLTARGRIAAGPRLHVRLEGSAGPYASLFAFAEVKADADDDPCWTLEGGVEGDFGVDVVIPDLFGIGEIDLAEFGPLPYGIASTEIAHGSCQPRTAGPGDGQAGPPSQAAYANPDFTPWGTAYGGMSREFPYEGPGAQIEWTSLTPTIDGRFMLAGSNARTLAKLGTDGAPVWAERFIADHDWADTLIPDLLPSRVVPASDGGMLVLAYPYALLKLDSAGALQWSKRFDVSVYRQTWLRLTDAVGDGGDGYYVAGTYGQDLGDAVHDADGWVMRLDRHGAPVWSVRLDTPGQGDMIRAAFAFGDGVVVAGSTWSEDEVRWIPFVVRLDGDGQVVFQREVRIDDCNGGRVTGHIVSGQPTRDGDLIFAHTYEGQGYQSGLVRIEPDGAFAWASAFGTGEPNHLGPVLSAFAEIQAGGYVAAGRYSGAQTASDWWLSGLDALGRPTWSLRIGAEDVPATTGRDEDGYPALVPTNDGGLVIAGFGEADAYPDHAMLAMKVFAKDGTITFGAGAEMLREPLTLEVRNPCLSTEAAHFTVGTLDVPVVNLGVTVEQYGLQTRALTP